MRRLLSFSPVAAAAILFTAALTTALRASAPSRIIAPPAQTSAPDQGNYVGPGSCSAVACHGAIRPVAGARILQTEYSTWVSQDRHARAAEVLGNTVSQRMGRILGIGNPQQAQKCLACHALDVPAALRGRNFARGRELRGCHPATGCSLPRHSHDACTSNPSGAECCDLPPGDRQVPDLPPGDPRSS